LEHSNGQFNCDRSGRRLMLRCLPIGPMALCWRPSCRLGIVSGRPSLPKYFMARHDMSLNINISSFHSCNQSILRLFPSAALTYSVSPTKQCDIATLLPLTTHNQFVPLRPRLTSHDPIPDMAQSAYSNPLKKFKYAGTLHRITTLC
jgi:hypothetical protein